MSRRKVSLEAKAVARFVATERLSVCTHIVDLLARLDRQRVPATHVQ
jgi:hypothetical protein